MTSLPAEIGTLTRLSIEGSGLVALIPEIGDLVSLESLHMSNTQVTALPPEIGNLTNLRVLALRDNQLTGDITDIAEGIRDTAIVFVLGDGTDGNDCLSVADPDVGNWLDANSPGWDECDNP